MHMACFSHRSVSIQMSLSERPFDCHMWTSTSPPYVPFFPFLISFCYDYVTWYYIIWCIFSWLSSKWRVSFIRARITFNGSSTHIPVPRTALTHSRCSVNICWRIGFIGKLLGARHLLSILYALCYLTLYIPMKYYEPHTILLLLLTQYYEWGAEA